MNQELREKYKNMLEKKSLRQAEELLQDALVENPLDADAYFYMANLYQMKGDIGKAIRAFSKTLELDENNTEAAISLSVLYNDIGKYEQGQKIFEKYSSKVRTHEPEEVCKDILINKKFSLRHLELAELYLTHQRFEEALIEYNKAINLDPEEATLKIKLAKIYAQKGYSSKAIEILNNLKVEKPNFAPARVALGIVLYGKGKVIEAQTEWQKALSSDPTNEDAKMYLSLSSTASETTLS